MTAVQQAARRARFRAAGRCLDCGQARVPDRQRCRLCLVNGQMRVERAIAKQTIKSLRELGTMDDAASSRTASTD
jgi:uncharacterized OB-fold protein